MISAIVKFLVSFPKLGALFFKIHDEYKKELSTKRSIKHGDLIDDWVRDAKTDEDTGVRRETPEPRLFRE